MKTYPRDIHRTLNVSASGYEKKLSGALFEILSRKTHDLAGIVAALNQSGVRPSSGQSWTEETGETPAVSSISLTINVRTAAQRYRSDA